MTDIYKGIILATAAENMGRTVSKITDKYFAWKVKMLDKLGPDRFMEWERMQKESQIQMSTSIVEAAMSVLRDHLGSDFEIHLPGMDVDAPPTEGVSIDGTEGGDEEDEG
jgi:hypothetical protein